MGIVLTREQLNALIVIYGNISLKRALNLLQSSRL